MVEALNKIRKVTLFIVKFDFKTPYCWARIMINEYHDLILHIMVIF